MNIDFCCGDDWMKKQRWGGIRWFAIRFAQNESEMKKSKKLFYAQKK